MGIHTGHADARGGDYFGPALNRTARLMAAGHGGQVLLSLAAQQVVRGGSWLSDHRNARAAFRLRSYPDGRVNLLGFRVVCASPL